jgi:hypothetical protein
LAPVSPAVACRTAGMIVDRYSRRSRTAPHPFGELLIDLEENRTLKAVIWGLLREMERG